MPNDKFFYNKVRKEEFIDWKQEVDKLTAMVCDLLYIMSSSGYKFVALLPARVVSIVESSQARTYRHCMELQHV